MQPERGFDWDLGLSFRFPVADGFTFNLVYFYLRMQDLILWQPSGQIWQPENVSKSQNEGLELSAALKFLEEVASISGNYTFLEAKNRSDMPALNGKYLIYRPRHTANFTLNLAWKNVGLGFEYHIVGKRYINTANTISLEAYQDADINLKWQQGFNGWQTEISVQVKNVFDQSYQIVVFQPMPGRELRLGLTLHFRQR